MMKLKPIKKGGRSYPLSRIEAADAEDLNNVCAGFIHGGKADYLELVLTAGRLRCSGAIRAEGKIKPVRDTYSKGPDGQGVYFRFVPSGIDMEKVLQTFTGSGATGGLFMFMPSRNVAGLSFFTMSAGDYKYGNSLTLERLKGITREVRRSIGCRRKGINNSEIAFYREVPLSKITEIYIAETKVEPGSLLDNLLISKGYSPDRKAGKTIRRWGGGTVNNYINYLRYYRTGAATATHSAFSLPSLYDKAHG